MENSTLEQQKKQELENARLVSRGNQANLARLRGGVPGQTKKFGNMGRPHDIRLNAATMENKNNTASQSREEKGEGNQEQSEEQKHAERLKNAVNANSLLKNAQQVKQMAEVATPMGALSLLKQIDFMGDMPIFLAFGAAALKDLFDFVFNEFMLGPVISALYTIFSSMMLFLVGAGEKKKTANGMLKRIMMLVAGGIIDSIPGIGFLPIEFLTMGAVYFMILTERKNAQSEE